MDQDPRETAAPDGVGDSGTADPGTTPAAGDGTIQGHEGRPTEETFFDPATLPDDLKAGWKKLQGVFTKRMQEIKGIKDSHALVQRFYNDPDFARQVVQQRAAQLGVPIGQSGAVPAPMAAQSAGEPPAEFVEAMRQQFPEELQWMVPYQAKAWWAANQQAMAPIMQRLQTHETTRADEQWSTLEADMDERYPHWREDEAELAELTGFLRSGALRHKKFGNKLEVLWKALKGDALGVSEATRRMTQAGRNRVSTGTGGRHVSDNVQERVMKATTPSEAFRIAAEAAAQEVKGR